MGTLEETPFTCEEAQHQYVSAVQHLVGVGHLRELQKVSTLEEFKESGALVIGAAVSLERLREQLYALAGQPDKPTGTSNAAPSRQVTCKQCRYDLTVPLPSSLSVHHVGCLRAIVTFTIHGLCARNVWPFKICPQGLYCDA